MAAGKLVFSEQRFLVWENNEGPSHAGIADKETSEIGLAKGQRERSQPVVDEEIAPAPEFHTQVVFRNCACAQISDTGTYSSLQDFRRTSKPNPSSASATKLSDLQRLYFVYYMRAKDAKNDTPSVAAQQLYNVGLQDKIWNVNLSPPGFPECVMYLSQKVKNYRFQRQLKVEADKQIERLREGLESSKKKTKVNVGCYNEYCI